MSVKGGNTIFNFLVPLNGLRIIAEEKRWHMAKDYVRAIKNNFKRLLKYYPKLEKYKVAIDKIEKHVEENKADECVKLVEEFWAKLMKMLRF